MNKNVNQSYDTGANTAVGEPMSMSDKHECTDKCEKMIMKSNGQWSLEKRCWEGYKPVPGKKAYSKGSCEPVSKEEHGMCEHGCGRRDHEPIKCRDIVDERTDWSDHPDYHRDSTHVYRKGMLRQAKERAAKEKMAEQAQAQSAARVKAQEDAEDALHEAGDKMKTRGELKRGEVAPEGSKNRETYLKAFGKSEVEISLFDNGDIDLLFGEDVPLEYESALVDMLEKKEWSPKAEHKSDKGGLTEAGRKSYNKATGGNLKAPQPGGGPRKRSFCARNKGQIKMHGIDCKKDPEKRACKARRRWKCSN